MAFFFSHFPQIWWVYRFNKKINVYLPRVLYIGRITRKLLKLEMIGHGPLQATYTAMFNTALILLTLIFVLWMVELGLRLGAPGQVLLGIVGGAQWNMPYLYHEINCLLKKENEDVECPVSLEKQICNCCFLCDFHLNGFGAYKICGYRFLFHLNSLYADKEDIEIILENHFQMFFHF